MTVPTNTSQVISFIQTAQAGLEILSVFNILGDLFPSDTDVKNGSTYDYVVIGGGNAGSVVSTRLVEAGHTVLVIEAGSIANIDTFYPQLMTFVKGSRADFSYRVETDDTTNNCHTGSGMLNAKVLGGSGLTDYPTYARGNPSNYFKWSKTVQDVSFKWENMIKYFIKTESLKDPVILNSSYGKHHGTEGKISITRNTHDICDEYIEGFRRTGQPTPLDNIGNASLGYSRGLYRIYNGTCTNPGLSYLGSIKLNRKLNVSLNSLATRIIFDSENRAIGVEFLKDSKIITVKAKQEIIVSAGPIKSPQLLMLSGVGPQEELKKWNLECLSDLPVGKNLQNNVGGFLVHKTNKKLVNKPPDPHKFVSPLVVGYATIKKYNKYPNYETINFIIDNYFFFYALCGFTLGLKDKICDHMGHEANNTQLLATILINLDSKSRGEILLNSNDPKDPPNIKPNYYSNHQDLDAITEQIEHYMKVVSTPYFKDMGIEFLYPKSKCEEFARGSKNYYNCLVKCMITLISQFVGTNSMGSVIDTKFRVYGVKRLRIVDASIIPNTISGNTNAVIVATAEKAAEAILLGV